LLSYFLIRPNKTISHRELLQAVWGPDYGEELEYLRVFVNRLRKKIELDPSSPASWLPTLGPATASTSHTEEIRK